MAPDLGSIFETLMALGPIHAVVSKSALKRIGLLVDLAGDLDRDDGTARALEWCDVLSKRKLTDQQATLLEYFRANAWANRQRVSGTTIRFALTSSLMAFKSSFNCGWSAGRLAARAKAIHLFWSR
ncbi:MAG TPA: hypothetical protein VFC54_11085 [Pseudolabrys sp.]|nr:hypothetical protein [Pseudolabrys sp.]